MSQNTQQRKFVLPEYGDLDDAIAEEQVKKNKFMIFEDVDKEHPDFDREEAAVEKAFCCISPMDFKQGGSGQVLYLTMIQYFTVVFLILSLIQSPILYILYDVNVNQEKQNINSQAPKGLFNMDVLTQASIQAAVSQDAATNEGGNQEVIDMAYDFCIYLNLATIVFVILAVFYWYKMSNDIVEAVDNETHTPSDVTLMYFNIPERAKVDDIKKWCANSSPGDIREENVQVAKCFDEKIGAFKNMLTQAKVLRDLRTQELRRLEDLWVCKGEIPNRKELTDMIMEDDQQMIEPPCCANPLQFKIPLEVFKLACKACDAVEQSDSDGYNIDDFDNVQAQVTFKTERKAFQVLEKYTNANECRACRDCCGYEQPEELIYRDQNGDKKEFKIKPCMIEPGDINWENLGVRGWNLAMRDACFILIVVTVSMLSFVAIWQGQSQLESIPAPTNCISTQTTSFDGFTPTYDAQLIANTEIKDQLIVKTSNNNDCTDSSDVTECNKQLDYYKAIRNDSDLSQCQCSDKLITQPGTEFQKACEKELQNIFTLQVVPFLLTLWVLIMNSVMTQTVLYSVPITCPHSKTEEKAKLTVWIAITQFANMSLIPLIVAWTGEIDANWQQKVGMNILSNFALYSFTPNVSGLISPFVQLCIDKGSGALSAIDQDDQNQKMAGPDLLQQIQVRYSYFICLLACCIMYSASFPILLPVGFIGMLITYWVEKITLFYAQRKIDLSSKLNTQSNDLQPWIIVLQCIWCIWIFSNPYFFVSDADQAGTPITGPGGYISKFLMFQSSGNNLDIFFLLLAIFMLAFIFFGRLVKIALYNLFCCFLCDDLTDEIEKASDEEWPSESLVGIVKTQDILENPYQKELLESIDADDDQKKEQKGSTKEYKIDEKKETHLKTEDEDAEINLDQKVDDEEE